MIPNEAKASMQGAMASLLSTVSADGVPNICHISQVWYVDDRHVATSFQFFSKTVRNIRENPHANIRTFDPSTGDRWVITVRYDRTETEGDVFDEMEMQLEAIASMSGMEDVFHLKGADIYEVLAIERIPVFPPEMFAVTSSGA